VGSDACHTLNSKGVLTKLSIKRTKSDRFLGEIGYRRDAFLILARHDSTSNYLQELSEGEAAARGGDGAAELFGGFEPFLNDDFYVGESFLVGLSVGGAAGKFGDFRDKRFVGLTPIDDDFVFRRRVLLPSGS
jgi:hypothetical protein